jgi:predicted phosphodiesterase
MNIQLLSDLHFEFFDRENDHLGNVGIHPDADVIVLAGDIDNGDYALIRASKLAMSCGKPVIFVPGNHEFYRQDMQAMLKKYRKGAPGVHVLLGVDYPDLKAEEKFVIIDGVRFCGGTLWTNFKLYEGSVRIPTQREAIASGQNGLNDFRLIKHGNTDFTAEKSVQYHNGAYKVIMEVLNTPFEGKTVVVTHHGMHSGSIHPQYSPSLYALDSKKALPGENPGWMINPAFCSHLPELVAKADLCLHGHTHKSLDYMVDNCRVVANPRGYPLNNYGDIRWENTEYETQKLITI